jgi:predicted  nucleic acid-binding Zn-ribbon protein
LNKACSAATDVPVELHELMLTALQYRLSLEVAKRKRERRRHAAAAAETAAEHKKELRALRAALAACMRRVETFETEIEDLHARSAAGLAALEC